MNGTAATPGQRLHYTAGMLEAESPQRFAGRRWTPHALALLLTAELRRG